MPTPPRLAPCVEAMPCSNFAGWDGGVVAEEVTFVDTPLSHPSERPSAAVKTVPRSPQSERTADIKEQTRLDQGTDIT